MKLNDKEQKILSMLRVNGRETITRIAKENNLPISSVANSLKKMQKENIIKHKTIVDFEKIGFPHIILMNIRGESKEKNNVLNWLKNSENVNTAKVINDGFDFHIEAIFENKKHKINFIEKLKEFYENIEITTHEVISTIKYEEFLTNKISEKKFD